MKRLFPIAVLVLAAGDGVAREPVPLPRPRPDLEAILKYGPPAIFVPADHLTVEPSRCLVEVQQVAVVEPIALINGAEMCGSPDMVRLKAVKTADGKEIEVAPPAELRCQLAASLAAWLRDELPDAVGGEVTRLVGYNSYECRPRNRIFGINVKLSEHAKGNALDIRALVRGDGQVIDPTSVTEARPLREAIRKSACGRFSTVLGPGSDGHHEKHIHVDIAERRNNYKICQWAVRDPPPMVAASTKTVAAIPLPPPKPVIPHPSTRR